jgi:hypothetical protein
MLKTYLTLAAIMSTIHFSNGPGIIFSGLGFVTALAKASAAEIFISSVILLTQAARAHLNIHGNTSTLLI